MAERTLSILVQARDLATRTLRGVNRELGKMGGIASRGAGTAAKNLGKLAIAGAGIALVLGVGAVHAAADFESQLNTINTVAGRTPAQLDAIGDGIRKIARDTGRPLEELTAGFYDLVSAGVAADQAQRVLASSNRLAIGGLGTAAEGVDLLTTALNSYGVAARDQGAQSERFADIFAKAIEKGKVKASELAASFATVGPIAAASGIEIEELAAGYSRLTAKGVPAAEAATQMRSALVGLLSPNAKLNAIQKQTKINFAELAKEKGLVAALDALRTAADKAGVPLIDVLGRVEGFNFALATTGDNLAAYNADLAAMGDSAGTAARQMSERQQGLNFQLARLKALARDAGITIGSKLLPKLTPLAERAVAFLEVHQPDIERFGDEIAAGFDKAAAFAEKIPWESVGSGLRVAATWAEKLMGVFLGLPPEVQGTIVALAGLNKLTGGAVSGIVGELGKGLIKGVLGMNAGVVNINAGVVNGGGGLPGGGVAGGRGLNPLMVGGAVAGGLGVAALFKGTVLDPDMNARSGGIVGSTQQMIAGGASLPALESALRATKDGLAQFNAGPLTDLLYGQQIADLKTAQVALETAIGDRRPGGRGTMAGGRPQDQRVAREEAAVSKFVGSTAPSMRSMEAHLANLKALQASANVKDASGQSALLSAISRLSTILSGRQQISVTVPVTITARSIAGASLNWSRVSNRSTRSGTTID